jgi:hypothetical protein
MRGSVSPNVSSVGDGAVEDRGGVGRLDNGI